VCTRCAYLPEHSPRHSEAEYPARRSDGESDDEEEANAEFSTGKVPYVAWEASLY